MVRPRKLNDYCYVGSEGHYYIPASLTEKKSPQGKDGKN